MRSFWFYTTAQTRQRLRPGQSATAALAGFIPRWQLVGMALPLLLAAISFALPAVQAQEITLDMGEGGSVSGRVIQLILMMTVLSLAPGILIMTTSFVRIVVVLSLLRSAMGTQQTPPNMVMVSLALFLTAYVMAPTFENIWDNALEPLIEEEIEIEQAYDMAIGPMRAFMLANTREKDLALFVELAREDELTRAVDVKTTTLIPAFMISELRRAFEIGFLLYIPFIVIDLVIASVLMSMGMMMLPPVMIATPFKLIFFVLVDGWTLIAGSLVRSFGVPAPPPV